MGKCQQTESFIRNPDIVGLCQGIRCVIGRALVRRLGSDADVELVGSGATGAPGGEPDLRDPAAVDQFFAAARPDRVFVVGGR